MNQDKPIVLIMAGGKGERFWPRSRVSTPKQLQKVYSNKTLLKETLERALTITTIDRVYIRNQREISKNRFYPRKKISPKKISSSNRKERTRPPS